MSSPTPSSSPPPATGGDASVTEKELEVAQVLLDLRKLAVDFDLRRRPVLPEYLRWGARKRRSVPDDEGAPAPPIPPPPSLPAADDGEHGGGGEEGRGRGSLGRGVGGGGCGAAGRERASPPTPLSFPPTPLSFPPSGGEEADKSRPQPATAVKSFKNTKRHKERVEQQNRIVASLSMEKANLQRSIAELRGHHQRLEAKKAWLTKLKAKLQEEAAIRAAVQREKQQYTVGPAIHQSPASASMGPLRRDGQWAGGGRGRAVLDLNARPVEEEEEEGGEELGPEEFWWEDRRRRQEISAQARRKRLEIQRVKNSSAAPVGFKMQRLR